MKKFLGLILLSFLWCNIVIAECQKGDCVNGVGTYSLSDDLKYIGEFQLGQFHGQGTLLSYGDKYVGEFKEGNYHGDGILTYSNGDKYVGEFQLGQFHGQGTFTDSYGNVKEGRWSNNVFGIEKVETKNNESTNVVANKEKSTITYSNGDKYVGEFKDGKRHGKGTYNSSEGWIYVGDWKDGKMHGQGTYTGEYGDEYVGEWQDGMRHGQGTHTYSTAIWSGEWFYDDFKKGEKKEISTTKNKTSTTKNNSASSKKSICSVNRSLFCSAQRVLDICGTYENESAFNSCMYRFDEIGNTLERTYGLTNNEFVMGVTSCKC